MAGLRIRWRGVARAVAVVVIAMIALRLVPELLRAPEPPPLGADVGLPKAKPATRKPAVPIVPKPAPRRSRKAPRPRRRAVADAPAATAAIGTRTRYRPRRHHRDKPPKPVAKPVESTPPPAAPEAAPEPLPEPPPTPESTPGDGSEEFAPH